jgi:hypothetical protein
LGFRPFAGSVGYFDEPSDAGAEYFIEDVISISIELEIRKMDVGVKPDRY